MAAPKGTIVVTGANGTLGTGILQHIFKSTELSSNYSGIYTVRKAATASHLKNTLNNAPDIHCYQTLDLDLGSIASVREAAENINNQVAKEEISPIRALILNAGYQEHTTLTMSKDNYDLSWQVNYLANLLLSLLLLQSMDKEKGRILIVGSWSHDVDDKRNEVGGNKPYNKEWRDLFPGPEALAKGTWSTPEDDPSWLSGYRRYGASKLCAVMLQQDLGYRLAHDPSLSGISVIGVDPGAMGSDLARRGSFILSTLMMKTVMPLIGPVMVRMSPNGPFRTGWKSGGDVVSACFDIETPKNTLYLNGSEEMEVAKDARDGEKRRVLWRYGIEAAGIKEGDTILKNWQ